MAAAATKPGAVGAKLAPLFTRWAALPARERRLLLIAGSALLALIVWLAAIQPAWRTLRAAPAQLDTLEAQWQGMQRLAGEAVGGSEITLSAASEIPSAATSESMWPASARRASELVSQPPIASAKR